MEQSVHRALSSEWASIELDNELADANVEHNPLEELTDAFSMANMHVAALENALFRHKVLTDQDIRKYMGLERATFKAHLHFIWISDFASEVRTTLFLQL